MRLGRVRGSVWCTVKDRGLEARRLLVVDPCDPSGAPSGPAVLALDAAGAGAFELVFFTEGREASLPFAPDEVPADACVVGIVDRVDRAPGPRSS